METLRKRLADGLESRRETGLLRSLAIREAGSDWLELSDNDYLELARDPAVVAAARDAADRFGCSASASPLVAGYRTPHQRLETMLCEWHGFPHGIVWNSGYAANHAVLSLLPQPGDLVFADRLIHNSMIAGILHSGARLVRYRHNDVDHLRELLKKHPRPEGVRFVVTESIFSMDGDAPDLTAIAALKETHPFCFIVDEAHALGWYGPKGAGLAAETGCIQAVDVLVGTLGKALGSQGAYTLFHESCFRDHLINHAGEFIYSTYLSPIATAAATAAVERTRQLSADQPVWRKASRIFRQRLRKAGWEVPEGDSPIVPVIVGESDRTLALATFLRENRVHVGAIRPPTVPAGTGRLRVSLKRGFTPETGARVEGLLRQWRAQHP